MNQKRPVNLDLASFKFPSTAVASILHRVSGVVIFLLLPFILYILNLSLYSRSSFDELQALLATQHGKFGIWMFASALTYHVIAGIRHILLDLGIGEDIAKAKRSALAVIVVAFITIILLGVWICCPM
ncbi:MAG: succinate dehydrogenase, cytochrome b556 subunit [Legionellales bacterium RIFCSPHIGHO2_12_FULL_35_11]|nr:MAG: succinate dehydrogenase, cytochrome b556 subunit [Legionellales bacterium RIFCSPHIGHO2_12_FULL_35_11]